MTVVETLEQPTQHWQARSVSGLDHVVIRSPNPERAVALYGGRLGLDFALDRTNQDWGSRLLFFVCGGVRVEIGHSLAKGVSDLPDSLWGSPGAWRTARDAGETAARGRGDVGRQGRPPARQPGADRALGHAQHSNHHAERGSRRTPQPDIPALPGAILGTGVQLSCHCRSIRLIRSESLPWRLP